MILMFKPTAFAQMQNIAINSKQTHEVGGVLLGCKCAKLFYVTDVVESCANKSNLKHKFNLNGKEATNKAAELIKKRKFLPTKVVGLWHSHPCNTPEFSLQDEISNSKFSSVFGDIVSIIVTFKKKDKICINSYFIKKASKQ